MTMPHLMNCIHSGDGWCPACVAELGNSREELLSALIEAQAWAENSAVYEQNTHDEPPEPRTEWDYNTGRLADEWLGIIAKARKQEEPQ